MLSVIIPTRNRVDLLNSALDSLTRQVLKPSAFEILVIDNGSTDDTVSSAGAFSERLPNLRYAYEAQLGLHAGRHRGVLEARGDILVFADDDIEALPTWLSSIQDAFADPDVVLVGGNNLPLYTRTPPAWLIRLWNRPSYGGGRALPQLSILELPGGCREINPYYVWGCNFSIRRSVLLAAGGFHPDAMPKELIRFRGDGETHVSWFVQNTGLKCLFHPGASVCHKVTPERMTFAYFRLRGFNQGISDSFTALRKTHLGDPSEIPSRASRFAYRAGSCSRLKFLLTPNADVRRALKEVNEGHGEGYAFHQRAFECDPEVRAWVLKRSYL